MRILFLDQYSDLGGAQRCLLDLLPAIRERGWTASAAVPGAGPLVAALAAQGVCVEPIECGPFLSGRKSPADVLRFLRQMPRLAARIKRLARSADVVYVNGPRLLPAVAWAAAGRPILFHCHSHLSKRSAAWLAGRSLRKARATTVACCRFAAEPLTPYLGRVHIVYNGVPEGPRRMRPAGGRRIGVIGRIAPEKGQAEFLRAARLLSGCQFVICGDALFSDPAAQRYRQALAELASGLPVEFLGWRDDVYAVLSEIDLLVVPSTQEPATTRVILEAYACGVPVVAFRSGGIPEVVTDELTGFLVDLPTPEALAARIRALLDDSTRLETVARAGHARWREQFTLDRYREQMLGWIDTASRGSDDRWDSAR